MFGTRLRNIRIEKGYSQKDLAEFLGVNVRTVSRWEQNNNKPNQEEMEKISKLFGIPEDELLADELSDENNLEETNQNILNRLSDSVDNLVTGQENMNETITSNQDQLICELKRQNEDLLSKIQSYEKSLDSNEMDKRHRKIRTIVITVTCIVIVGLMIFAWIYWINNGLNGTVQDGPIEMGTPSYSEVDDGE